MFWQSIRIKVESARALGLGPMPATSRKVVASVMVGNAGEESGTRTLPAAASGRKRQECSALLHNCSTMNWDDVRYLVAVARDGSLSAAARALAVDQTTVSRRLKVLEQALGARLFERVGGLWQTTPAGDAALALGQRIEEEMIALAHSIHDRAVDVSGLVRVAAVEALASACLASACLAPRAAPLLASHPRLLLELIGGDRNLNLGRREADLAVRLARPVSGDVVIRKLGDIGYGVYGRRGEHEPGRPSPANQCRWVGYDDAFQHLPEMRWLLARIDPSRLAVRSNSLSALAQAVATGAGLGVLPCFLVQDDERLMRLSGPLPVVTRESWLVVHPELRQVPRIRVVSDWIIALFDADTSRFSGQGP